MSHKQWSQSRAPVCLEDLFLCQVGLQSHCEDRSLATMGFKKKRKITHTQDIKANECASRWLIFLGTCRRDKMGYLSGRLEWVDFLHHPFQPTRVLKHKPCWQTAHNVCCCFFFNIWRSSSESHAALSTHLIRVWKPALFQWLRGGGLWDLREKTSLSGCIREHWSFNAIVNTGTMLWLPGR